MKKSLILILAAIPTGIAVGAVDAVFGRVLLYIGEVRDAHVSWLVPFLGVVGAAMAWAYKNYGAGCESGMGMVFEAGHGREGGDTAAADTLRHVCDLAYASVRRQRGPRGRGGAAGRGHLTQGRAAAEI